MSVIAIIPARGGSKRIPQKNIKLFAGLPIIAYSIKVAQRCQLFSRVIISTDSEEIARVARGYGAEVPFMRPTELADDFAGTDAVILHALNWFAEHGGAPEYFCCIYPTAPFLQSEYLRRGFELLVAQNAATAFSVTTYAYTIFRSLRLNQRGRLEMLWPENFSKRSQDLPHVYHDAGQFYWGNTNRYLREKRIFSSDALPIAIPRNLVQDIDTLEDWELAERMYLAQQTPTAGPVENGGAYLLRKGRSSSESAASFSKKSQRMKTLLILTEAGSEIGFGHLTRCRSIAAAFAQHGYQTKLIVQADGVQVEADEQLVRWHELGAVVKEAICNTDIVLVDSLIASETLVGSIQDMNLQTVVVDDYLHRSYTKGVIVDWTIGAEARAYLQRNPPTHYLLGSQYCALRPPFWTPPNRVFTAQPEKILVTFGGSDIRRLTCPLVRKLISNFPKVELHAVVGGGVSCLEEYARLEAAGAHVHFSMNAIGMRDLMDTADLAISGGGQTLYELACRGLPAIVVNLIDNQTDDIKGFSAKGFATVAGEWNEADLMDRIESCARSMWGSSQRETASAIGRSLVDGLGGFRLVAEIERAFYGSKSL